jgi:aldehyde:ferredoxin oxidoreductase
MIQHVALPLGSLEVSWVKDEKALDENSRRMVNETQPCGPVKGKGVDPHVFQEEFSDHYTNKDYDENSILVSDVLQSLELPDSDQAHASQGRNT